MAYVGQSPAEFDTLGVAPTEIAFHRHTLTAIKKHGTEGARLHAGRTPRTFFDVNGGNTQLRIDRDCIEGASFNTGRLVALLADDWIKTRIGDILMYDDSPLSGVDLLVPTMDQGTDCLTVAATGA
jgi:hypothetical protein